MVMLAMPSESLWRLAKYLDELLAEHNASSKVSLTGDTAMSTDTQIEKILETLSEYDKSTVQRALLRWQDENQIPAGYLTTRRQLSDS